MKYTEEQLQTITDYDLLQSKIDRLEDSFIAELPLEERNALEHALDLLFGERDDLRQEYLEILSGS